jgi:glycosyltransferase involved in cell wall biosynthesis
MRKKKVIVLNRSYGATVGGSINVTDAIIKILSERVHKIETTACVFGSIDIQSENDINYVRVRIPYLRSIASKYKGVLSNFLNRIDDLMVSILILPRLLFYRYIIHTGSIIQIILPALFTKKYFLINIPGPISRMDIALYKMLGGLGCKISFFGVGVCLDGIPRYNSFKFYRANPVRYPPDFANDLRRKRHHFLSLTSTLPLRVITVGRNTSVKRLKCIYSVLEAITEFPIEWTIVTNDSINLIQNISGIHKVSFMEDLPNNEVAKLYAQSHIYISLSSFESYGWATVEAMQVGLPIIATGSGYPAQIPSVYFCRNIANLHVDKIIDIAKSLEAIYKNNVYECEFTGSTKTLTKVIQEVVDEFIS